LTVRRVWRAFALGVGWAGVVIATLLVLSFLGSLFWVLDLAANFRPQASVVLVFLGIVAVAGRARVPGWTTLAVGLIGLVSLVPHLLDAPPPIADGSPTIRIMSFNVGISNPNRTAVAEFIAHEDPDVVFIFESSFEWEDTIRGAGLPLQIVLVVPRGRLAGVTVLARPELRPGRLDVELGGEVAAVEVDLGDERVAVLGIHPVSPTSPSRASARDGLIARAADWVATRAGEVVVVGDLNATPWSHAYSTLRLRGGLVDTLRGKGLQPTWPQGWGALMIPIDHVLHTTGLGSADRRTGPAFGSAHRPVLVEIGVAG
jgi:endonuclease/exonuclease/phosphatase (EEP) superfamily protein YafD